MGRLRPRRSLRSISLLLVTSFACALTLVPFAGIAEAHTMSRNTALHKTASLAKAVARKHGFVYYLAFACRRRTRHSFNCIGAVFKSQTYGCAQRIRVSYASSRSRRVVAHVFGRIVCGNPSGDTPSGGGGGGDGGGAICAIHQSVCI